MLGQPKSSCMGKGKGGSLPTGSLQKVWCGWHPIAACLWNSMFFSWVSWQQKKVPATVHVGGSLLLQMITVTSRVRDEGILHGEISKLGEIFNSDRFCYKSLRKISFFNMDPNQQIARVPVFFAYTPENQHVEPTNSWLVHAFPVPRGFWGFQTHLGKVRDWTMEAGWNHGWSTYPFP